MTWATPVPILVFLGLSVLELGASDSMFYPLTLCALQIVFMIMIMIMYATDRQTDRRQTKTSLNAPAY